MIYKNGHYLAFVISERSRNELVSKFKPKFDRVICHHITLAFNLNESLFENIIEFMGNNPKVIVTGYICDEHLECFTATINGQSVLAVNDQHYHITHSIEPPAKPVDSNKAIREKTPIFCNIPITGSVELVKK